MSDMVSFTVNAVLALVKRAVADETVELRASLARAHDALATIEHTFAHADKISPEMAWAIGKCRDVLEKPEPAGGSGV